MIFFKYTVRIPATKDRIDMAVFPDLQVCPHNHPIGGLAVQSLEVQFEAFKGYSKAGVADARVLGQTHWALEGC